MLKVTNLEAGYGGSIVLHGVSLEVKDGEAVVLLGPNGHGKTTLLRTISGLIRPSAGRIEFDGKVLSNMSPAEIVAAGVVHIPQGDLPFPELTVLENLLMGAYLPEAWKQRKQKLEQVYELFPVLRERSNQLARTLSGGERRMLALGRGLMSNARLLIVDEPSLGLAPFLIEEVYRKIHDINKKGGLSVLLADENADHIAGFADRVYLLEMGSIVSEGSAEEMLKNEALLAAYLG
ncbi:MAG: ABC transporter ATP-binding protein [Anaerolineae bacterium]|nr:ABC transporter ATP-binding protein [Anaerolineae bacterium]MDW8071192.1 ABC transporter ATP-binding protein [Anaerolineae bacterium]